jgi:NADH:ubiquinone oxidoreductase subunit E
MPEKKKAPMVNLKQIDRIITSYRGQKWALIPLTQEIQEKVGYIPPEVIPRIASALGLFPAQVQGVITFYAQLYTAPRGRNIVRVCRGTACHVRGGKKVFNTVRNQLGIADGETSSDMQFSLETVACLGACALSPVMVVDNNYYGKMTGRRAEQILQGLVEKEK